MSKRNSVTISLIVGFIFFILFKGLAANAEGETILLTASLVYTFFALEATSTGGIKRYKKISYYIGGLLGLGFISGYNIYFNDIIKDITLIESFQKGLFISFAIVGSLMAFISIFIMKKQQKQEQ